MPANGLSRADENRQIRQEALREQLANKGLIQKVIETTKELDGLSQDETWKVPQMKAAMDARLKLVSKYLPDLKAVEHTDNSITSLSSLLQQVAQMSREATTAQLKHQEEKAIPPDSSDSKAV